MRRQWGEKGLAVAYDVVIVPTVAQVEEWRKGAARSQRGGLFAQAVLTFDAWVADLWELHGDGRALVDAALREALVMRAVEAVANERRCSFVGVVPFAARCVREAAGVAAFQRALDAVRSGASVPGLSNREHAFLAVIARYEDDLRARSLIEPGEAAAHLGRDGARLFPEPLSVLVAGTGALTWIQRQFFEACAQLDVTVAPLRGKDGLRRVEGGADLRFAFPAGRLAQPGLVADIVCSQGAGRVIVVCKDPIDMAARLELRLSQVGACMRVQAAKPFAETDFGRAYFAFRSAVQEDTWDPLALCDAARSFFGGFSPAEALAVDEMLRGDRIARREDALARLREASELFSQMEKLVGGGGSGDGGEEAAAVLERRVHAAAYRSGSWRAEQLAALRGLARMRQRRCSSAPRSR